MRLRTERQRRATAGASNAHPRLQHSQPLAAAKVQQRDGRVGQVRAGGGGHCRDIASRAAAETQRSADTQHTEDHRSVKHEGRMIETARSIIVPRAS